MKTCSVEGCNKKYRALGYCQTHYTRYKRYGDALQAYKIKEKRTCSMDGCNDRHEALGFCSKHYGSFRRYGQPFGKPKTERTFDMNTIGGRIGYYRHEKGWSISELSRKSNVSRQYLSLVEHGHNIPSSDTIYKISTALEVSLEKIKPESETH